MGAQPRINMYGQSTIPETNSKPKESALPKSQLLVIEGMVKIYENMNIAIRYPCYGIYWVEPSPMKQIVNDILQ